MKRKILVVLLVICSICILIPAVQAQGLSGGHLDVVASAEFLGEDAGDNTGRGVSGAGDVNGDGYDDILVGVLWNSDGGSDAGAAYLALGGPAGWSLGKSLGQSPLIKYTGQVGDEASSSVSGAGDVNGDGYDDFLVGAYGNGSKAGAAYLVLGSASPSGGSLGDGDVALQYTGEAVDDLAGQSVSGAGDVNGDGYDDFLVGAHRNDDGGDNAGAAYLILGSNTDLSGGSLGDGDVALQYTGGAIYDLAGTSVSGVGDVDGDGYDDFLIGAPLNDASSDYTGAAYLVLGSAGPAGGSLGNPSVALHYSGEVSNDYAGRSVSGAGDVNGDGYDDFLVGANHNGDGGIDAGAAYLVLGSASLSGGSLGDGDVALQYTGEAVEDYAGTSVSGAGDVNGDGYDDFLIGAYGNDDGGDLAGAAYLVLGSAKSDGGYLGEDSVATQFTGRGLDIAGASVSGAGDVNGDGYSDLLASAPLNNNNGGDDAGAAYLVLSDALTAGAGPISHRHRLAGDDDALPVAFDQARVKVDFAGNALSGADIGVMRHIYHPCDSASLLAMPIWDVSSAKMDSTTTVNLRFEYTDGQMAGMNESNLKLYHRPAGQPCAAWTEVPGSTVDAAANAVSVSGLTSLSQFTISDVEPGGPTAMTMGIANASFGQGSLWPAMAFVMLGVGTAMTLWRIRRRKDGFRYFDSAQHKF